MIEWVDRCMIVPAAQVEFARELASTLTGPAGTGLWQRALSVDGAEPATHYISSGAVDAQFAALLPLTTIDDEGETITTPGQPEILFALSQQAGMTCTLSDVAELLGAVDVSEQSPSVAISRMGLVFVAEPEDAP